MKKRSVILLCLAAVAAGALFVAVPVVRERTVPWKFVVVGDTRGTDNGVNAETAGDIAAAVIKEAPRFVLVTGDLVGGSADYERRLGQLTHWRAVFARPLAERGIAVYAVRGNRELPAGDPDVPDWGLVFSGDYALPQNGPYWEKGITYSFAYGNAFIIAVDSYLKRGRLSMDLSWMGEQLGSNRKPHVFAFSHPPLYPLDRRETDGNELRFEQRERDDFARMFVAAGGVAYFCGHDRAYDHAKVTVSTGAWFHQFSAGAAGAPAEQWEGSYLDPGVIDVAHADACGYLVVEIKGDRGTITFKKREGPGNYVAADTFRYVLGK